MQFAEGLYPNDDYSLIVPACLANSLSTETLYADSKNEGGVFNVNALFKGTFRIWTGSRAQEFPFDAYECSIQVLLDRVPGHTSSNTRIYFTRLGGGWRDAPKTLHGLRDGSAIEEQWTIHAPLFCLGVDPVSNWKSVVEYSFLAVRRSEAEVVNGFGVTFMLVMLNFTAFGVLADDVSTRLTMAVTVALSLVALKFAQTGAPKAARANWFDQFVNSSILFTLATAVVFSVLGRVDASENTDAYCAGALAVGYFLLCVTFAVRIRLMIMREHEPIGKAKPPTPARLAQRKEPFKKKEKKGV